MRKFISWRKALSIGLGILVIAVPFYTLTAPQAHAGLLSSSSVELSDPRPSNASTTYTVTYTFPGTTSIKCIDIVFGNAASDISISSGPSTATAPTGMTTTSAAKAGSGNGVVGGGLTDSNWTLYNTNNGVLQYEYSTGGASSATSVTITTTGVTNPSGATFYAQVATYSSLSTHSCTGLVDNSNVMALATSGGVSTSVTVDPTISFSVAPYAAAVNTSGDTVDAITTASSIAFGNVSAGGSATAAAQLLTTSTNAAHGYNIYIRYDQALTNANSDTIRDQSGTPGSAASFDGSTSQSSFAYTTDSATSGTTMGSNKWAGLSTTNTSIDNETAPQNAKALHVQYKLQLSNIQSPGTYSNVITYTATPTY